MSRYRESSLDCKVYVGDLPREASEKDLERQFSYYGPLKNVWVARNPPGFAFIEFDDSRDAEDAVRGLDGTTIMGSRVRVEFSSGKVRPKPWLRGGRPPQRSRRAFNPDDRCYECGGRGHYAYDCRRSGRQGGGSSRRRTRSRSRSRERRHSPSYSRSRSRSRGRYRSHSHSRSHSRDKSFSRERSRSAGPVNDDVKGDDAGV